MRPPLNPSPLPVSPPAADNRRRTGRLRCDQLRCLPLGEVHDLSASGLKVVGKGRAAADVGDALWIQLACEEQTLRIKAQVMRVEKAGFRRYLYGLQFVEVDEPIHQKLVQLARDSFDKKILA